MNVITASPDIDGSCVVLHDVKKVVQLRWGRRGAGGPRAQLTPQTRTTFLLHNDERMGILSVLSTAD